MNVLSGVIWGVKLDNPVHSWDIQATSRYIRAQQNASLGIHKLKERIRSLLLLLSALFFSKLVPTRF
jgi:hypothetical protein